MKSVIGRQIDDVRVGEELPELVKTVTLSQIVAYAGATWDFYRYHYDPEFARAQGMPAPMADGQMLGSYLAQLVMDWAGPNAFIKRLEFRLVSPVLPPDTLTCWGRVSKVDLQENLVTVDLGIRGADGRDVVTHASAVAELGEPLIS